MNNCEEVTTNSDRLSALPDDVVLSILSLLETKFAVQASILSKRWVNLWILLLNLNLDLRSFGDVSSFEKFVMWILSRRRQSISINNFIFTTMGESSESYIHTVIDYALSHNVQHLSLKSKFHYPINLYSSHILKTLELYHVVCPDRVISFENLEILCLDNVVMRCSDPFSCCLNLKKLIMYDCCYYDENPFTISAPQLIELDFSCCDIRVSSSCFTPLQKVIINSPMLTSFRFEMSNPMKFQLDYTDFVANVHIDLGDRPFDINFEYSEKLLHELLYILKRLGNAMTVALSMSSVELLSFFPHVLEKEAPPFSNLKSLKIVCRRWARSSQVAPQVAKFLLKSGMRLHD